MTDLENASPLAAALVGRFFIELALLAGAAIAAWRLAPDGWGWVAAIAAPLVVTVLWGAFLSPKARVPLPSSARLLIETVLFAAVGVALSMTGLWLVAILGFAIWAADRTLIALLSRGQKS